MSGLQLLKTMTENRRMNNLTTAVANVALGPKTSSFGSKAFKSKIIEDINDDKPPKNADLKQHFEAIVNKYEAEDSSEEE